MNPVVPRAWVLCDYGFGAAHDAIWGTTELYTAKRRMVMMAMHHSFVVHLHHFGVFGLFGAL